MFQYVFQNDKKMLQRDVIRIQLVAKSQTRIQYFLDNQFQYVDQVTFFYLDGISFWNKRKNNSLFIITLEDWEY